jgi:hypothetical protein
VKRRESGVASVALLLLFACASTKPVDAPIASTTSAKAGGFEITADMIGRSRGEAQLTQVASDRAYGYTEKGAVKVGGGFGEGSARTYRFLNALRGPNGEAATYTRVGTCCSFKTAASPFPDGEGLLEVYELTWSGAAKPVRLYFNWYDEGAQLIPAGLTAH